MPTKMTPEYMCVSRTTSEERRKARQHDLPSEVRLFNVCKLSLRNDGDTHDVSVGLLFVSFLTFS